MAISRLFYFNYWKDPIIRKLSLSASHLFIFLYFNKEMGESGIINIDMSDIVNKSKVDDIPSHIDELIEASLITVDNDVYFIHGLLRRNESRHINHLKSIGKDLRECDSEKIIRKFSQIYPGIYNAAIKLVPPYNPLANPLQEGYSNDRFFNKIDLTNAQYDYKKKENKKIQTTPLQPPCKGSNEYVHVIVNDNDMERGVGERVYTNLFFLLYFGWKNDLRGSFKETEIIFKECITPDMRYISLCLNAIDNYCRLDKVKKGMIMHLQKWLKEWQNYVDDDFKYKDPVVPLKKRVSIVRKWKDIFNTKKREDHRTTIKNKWEYRRIIRRDKLEKLAMSKQEIVEEAKKMIIKEYPEYDNISKQKGHFNLLVRTRAVQLLKTKWR